MGRTGPRGHEIIFNGYQASTQCQRIRGNSIIYLDRFDVNCNGLLGRSFINQYRMSGKCDHSGLKYEHTCINPGVWNKVGEEGAKVYCDGWLRYGTGNKWVPAKQVSGWMACGNQWGDPAPGIKKQCQCSSNVASGATSCSNHNNGCQCCRDKKIQYMDRQPVYCPNGKALTKFRARSCPGRGITTDFTCCKATWGMSDCQQRYTGCQVSDHRPVEYLDRHNLQCPEFFAMTSFHFVRSGCWGGHHRYAFTCCRIRK